MYGEPKGAAVVYSEIPLGKLVLYEGCASEIRVVRRILSFSGPRGPNGWRPLV